MVVEGTEYNVIAERDRLFECIKGKVETPEAFVEWLESKADDDIIGRASESWACPIHDFLYEACEAPSGEKDSRDRAWIRVNGTRLDVGRVGRRPLPAPLWVASFVYAVDERMTKKRRKRVRKTDAVEVLKGVLEQLAVADAGAAA